MLRWWTPVMTFRRTATSSCRLGDVDIRAGDKVVVSFMSANRDETVFERPDEFDITRAHNKHVAFGFGVHTCLGANLARLEMRLLLTELLNRLDFIELAGEPTWSQSLIVGGVKPLPIRYRVRP